MKKIHQKEDMLMKKASGIITSILVTALLAAASGCAKTNPAQNDYGEDNHVRTYNFPQAGFSFDLPDSVKLSKGMLYVIDAGPESMGAGMSIGYPLYINLTEEEYDSLSDEELENRAIAGYTFQVLCDTEGRDLETLKQDYIEFCIDAMGEEPTEDDLSFFDMIEVVHKDDQRVWYLYHLLEEETIREYLTGEYLEEYNLVIDAVDEIMKNAVYYEPEIWQSTQAGTEIRFETEDIDGNPVNSENLFAENKLTMVNIWGIDCGPCIREMPEIEAISKDFADKGVAVVGIVQELPVGDDKYLQETKKVIQDTGITYKNLRAWEGFDEILNYTGTPTTYFVDSEGRIVGEVIVGARVQEYRTKLEQYLEEMK